MGWRIGVDTGGTFTDVCLYDEKTQEIVVTKVSSTPSDPGQAVMDGLLKIVSEHAAVALADADLSRVGYFAHGTTVATNALIQGSGIKTGLITTGGFKDLLELGRQRRPKLYDFTATKPPLLVDRDLRLEVKERVRYDGSVENAIDLVEVREQAEALKEAAVQAVAVCFLYSYLRPDHELEVRQILEEVLPGIFLSISHQVLPEFREYERLSTTVVNASIGPVMRGYLRRLAGNLEAAGLPVVPNITQSNGCVMSFDVAQHLPVRTLMSGPSTGVVGAAKVSAIAGYPDIITFDMGGTSSDVALVKDSRPTSSSGMTLEGRPIQAPMLDINTVGAGGGSIAWVDNGGHLKVGPRSAGADPGPACYGLGNTEPTVTDANVVLGILNQESLLAGSMPIDASLSFAAVESLGKKLGLTVTETAQGIISVVTANMARAIRVVSVQRGYDPVDYALVAFGGAGPLHSARLAQELGITTTVIPQRPGAMSALGMLMTDLRADYTRTAITKLEESCHPRIAEVIAGLEAEAWEWVATEGAGPAQAEIRWVVDVRYVGQNYEIGVESPRGEIDSAWAENVTQQFNDAHERRYGYCSPDAVIEIVTFRVESSIKVPHAEFPTQSPGAVAEVEPIGSRDVYLAEEAAFVQCHLYERDLLLPGNIIHGPAIIEQYDTTVFILPNQRVVVDSSLVLITEMIPAPQREK